MDENSMSIENEIFELINELYQKDTGYLRPGKSDSFYNTSCTENMERFDNWKKERLLICSLKSLLKKSALIERIQMELNVVSDQDNDWFAAEASNAIDNIEKMLEE